MSRDRMQDLLQALQEDGWRLEQHDNGSGDLFKLEDDKIIWALML